MEFTSVVYAFGLLLSVFTLQSLGCSPDDTSDDIVDQVKKADVLLFGKALRKFPSPDFDGVYTVLFQVYCIYKGEVTQQKINITDAGLKPGICFEIQLQRNKNYLVMLNRRDGKLVPANREYEEYDLEEALIACGVKLRYPRGKSATNNNYQCPTVDPADCVMEPDVVPPLIDTDEKEESEEQPPYEVATPEPTTPPTEPTEPTSEPETTPETTPTTTPKSEPEDNNVDTETGAPVGPVSANDNNGASGLHIQTIPIIIASLLYVLLSR
ncbi:unnamed protein product [Owenia fusiformis]|uniref:Uncharacterized protein n=1 Tax=Owenia fusiformis TaxID=6347 RepID=A0A8S4NPT1_OWEFU|nr:unnamed protein product [Owenia fusiformis]